MVAPEIDAKIEAYQRWLLLLHQLPSKPAYLRVKLWRRLQALGAVALKNAVYALPASEQAQEDFEWLLKEIVDAGGEAVICEARFVDGLSDGEVRALFNTARDNDYAEIIEEARALAAKAAESGSADSLAEMKAQFIRLKARYSETVSIDFFDATGRLTIESLIGGLETTFMAPSLQGSAIETMGTKKVENFKNRVWVTRQGVHVDRIACSWMIKRFIDSEARFKFVQGKNYAPAPNELRFDMFDAEFTHEGDRCSCEVLLTAAGLDDPALGVIAEIVHDIDLKDDKFAREETPGVRALINSICTDTHDDEERIARGSVIFDDLYSVFRKKRTTHPPATTFVKRAQGTFSPNATKTPLPPKG